MKALDFFVDGEFRAFVASHGGANGEMLFGSIL